MPINRVHASEPTADSAAPMDIETEVTPDTGTAVSSITQGTPAAKLDGGLKALAPLLATLQEEYKKAYVDLTRTMLVTLREIRKRDDAVARFKTTFEDRMLGADPSQKRQRPFIPYTLREPLTINASREILNDSRCAAERTEMDKIQDAADAIREKYQDEVAGLYERAAVQESVARRKLLLSEYITTLNTVADGIVRREKINLGIGANSVSLESLSLRTTMRMLDTIQEKHWNFCPFIDKTEKGSEVIKGIYHQEYGSHHISDDRLHAHDLELIDSASKTLTAEWFIITTEVWTTDASDASQRAAAAEFARRVAANKTTEANCKVARVVLDNGINTIEPTLKRTIERLVEKHTSKKKNDLRKKSSGERETHRSTPASTGAKQGGNSRKGKHGQSKKSPNTSAHGKQGSQQNRHANQRDNPQPGSPASGHTAPASNQAGKKKKHRSRSRPRGDCNDDGKTNKRERK